LPFAHVTVYGVEVVDYFAFAAANNFSDTAEAFDKFVIEGLIQVDDALLDQHQAGAATGEERQSNVDAVLKSGIGRGK
jgi:hypothetical protein